MAASVEIKIMIDSGSSIPTIDQLNGKLNELGVKGEVSLKRVGEATRELGGHASTSLDSVRLLSQEFGLRLPRAMEAMLSRIPAVTTGLNAILSGVVAIAAVEVFYRAIQGGKEFYDKIFDATGQLNKLNVEMGKTASQKFFDVASIEEININLEKTNSLINTLDARRRDLNGKADWLHTFNPSQLYDAIANRVKETDAAKKEGAGISQTDDDVAKQHEDQHKRTLQEINDNRARASALKGYAADAADAHKKIAEAEENRRYTNQRTDDLNFIKNRSQGVVDPSDPRYIRRSPDSGKQQQDADVASAEAELAGKRIQLGEETALALMKADDERVQASLSGEALLQRKRLDDIRELTLQYRNEGKAQEETAARVAAINAKYAGDESERLVKRQNETAQAASRTRLGGLTGFARVDAEHDLRVQQNNTNPDMVRNGTSGYENLAAQQEFDQKRKELDDNFQAAAKQSIEQHTADQLGAFARIEAEAQKEIAERQNAYDAAYKDASGRDTATLQQQKTLADNIAAIKGDAANKETELRQRNAAEDLQYDQQAAAAERRVKEDGIMGWVASYKSGIVEIQAQEKERWAKVQQDLDKHNIGWQEYNQRNDDISRQANAEIAQQNQQLQHQIAGNLQAAFTDPIAFIKSRMEQMFFEIVAAWIMRMQVFKTLFGTTMGGLQPGAPGAGGAAQAGSAGGGMLGQAIHAATGLAMPRSAPGGSVPASASASPIAGMPGTTGFSNGHPDISKIYENIPAAAPPTGSNGGFGGSNPPVVGDGDDMIAQQAASSGNLSAAGQTAGVAMAGYAAEQTTVKAFETGNPLTGALGDAAAGATIGSLAGPEGALIGAAIGAGVGAAAGTLGFATGEAGNLGARAYYRQNIFPQLEADERQEGGGDFQTQIANANKTAADGLAYMRIHFGNSSADWVYSHYMGAELHKVTAEIAATAMGGRFAVTNSAAQFHTGGDITGFGSFHTSPTEGFIHAMMGETVMNTRAAAEHGPMLRAMNAGASATDIAAQYLAGSSRGSSGGNTYHQHDYSVSAIDAHSFSGFLKRGGAQVVQKHLNDYSGQYAGDGVNG